jgi:hypothetical protein
MAEINKLSVEKTLNKIRAEDEKAIEGGVHDEIDTSRGK